VTTALQTAVGRETIPAPAPGLHFNVPFAEYLRWPLMSQSILKCGRERDGSMLHLKYAMDEQGTEDVSDDMALGSALHTAFLEPEQMLERIAKWCGARRAGKEWEAFCDANQDKTILTPLMHEKLQGMVKALRRHPEVRKWLGRLVDVEVSAVGNLHGLPFKARADALTDDPLWDLKKVRSGDERTVVQTIYDFGYHIQGYIYRELFGRDRFCLGLVEGTPPFDVRVVELSPDWIKLGKAETIDLVTRVKRCLDANVWPGRSDKIEVIEPAPWMIENSGIAQDVTIGGQSAFSSEE
jgi:hypothetical protein